MSKAYLAVLRVIALILAFVLGMVSSIAILIGAGYFAVTNISIDGLDKFGIKIDTSAILEDDAKTSLRSMSLLQLAEEVGKVAGLSNEKSLDYLSEEYGLKLPPVGESDLFDAMRTLPMAVLFSQEGLDTAMKNIYVGDLLGYTWNTTDDVPSTDVNDEEVPDGENTETTPDTENTDNDNSGLENVEAVNAVVESADTETPNDGETEDTVTTEREGFWFDSVNNKEIVGVEALIADYTLFELIYEGIDVPEMLEEVPIGTIFGYKLVEDKWCKVNAQGDTVVLSGIMAIVADKTLNNLEGTLDNEPMGNLLGYEFVEDESYEEHGGYWVNPKDNVGDDGTIPPCAPFMQLIANTKFSDIDKLQSRVKVKDLIPESDRQSGYISLIDPETELDDISEEVNKVFNTATIGELVACGALELTDEEKANLESNESLKKSNLSDLLRSALSTPSVP